MSECSPLPSAEIKLVFCQAAKLDVLCAQAQNCPSLRHVVTIGSGAGEEEEELAEKSGLKLHTMEEVEVSSGTARQCGCWHFVVMAPLKE